MTLLDTDCLLNCFCYIPIGSNLINCMLVCHEWNQIINESNHYWNDCFDSLMRQLSKDPKRVFFTLYPKSFQFDLNELADIFESYLNINKFIEEYCSVMHLQLTQDCKEKNNVMILVGTVHAQIWKSTFEYFKKFTAKEFKYENFIELSAKKLKTCPIYQVLRELLVTDQLFNLLEPFNHLAIFLDRYQPLLTFTTFSKIMLFKLKLKKTRELSYENTLKQYFDKSNNNLVLPNMEGKDNLYRSLFTHSNQ